MSAPRSTTCEKGSAVAFSRATSLGSRPEEADLTRDMVGIGMNFAAGTDPSAPIEETLVHASALGMDEDDLRVLAVLTTWLGVHYGRINADRLVRCASESSSERVRAYWSAIAPLALKGSALRPARKAPRRATDRPPPGRDRIPDRAPWRGRTLRRLLPSGAGRDATGSRRRRALARGARASTRRLPESRAYGADLAG